MKKKDRVTYAFCGLSIAASAAWVVAAGGALKTCAVLYRNHYTHILGGKPLPILTEFVLSTAEAFSPALGGVLLGVLILLAGGCLLSFSPDDRSAYQRTLGCTTVAWVLTTTLVGTALLAFAMPMMSFIVGMQKAS